MRWAPTFAAFWSLGFRPFYWLASCFAAISVPLWALQATGWLPVPYLSGAIWHAHEMVFGYTSAVIVGFLFTAGRNWSGRPTPTGAPLAMLAALWLAGRILVLTPFHWPAAVVNVAFPIAAAIGLASALVPARNHRNYVFIAVLFLLGVASGAIHGQQLGLWEAPAWVGLQVSLDLIVLVIVTVAGRVVPMFTNNASVGSKATGRAWIEHAAIGSVVVLLLSDVFRVPLMAQASLAGVAAGVHGLRFLLWKPWSTLRFPLLWVLHGGYAWIVAHLALRSLAAATGTVLPSLATHALTVGAIGMLTLGMMVRSSRGHTARPLVPSTVDTASFALVAAAAVVRVAGGLLWPAAHSETVWISAVCWSLAMGGFAWTYWPILSRPRLDGRPG